MDDEEIIGDGSGMRIILVAWAEVEPKGVDGVERYLGRVVEAVVVERCLGVEELRWNCGFDSILINCIHKHFLIK